MRAIALCIAGICSATAALANPITTADGNALLELNKRAITVAANMAMVTKQLTDVVVANRQKSDDIARTAAANGDAATLAKLNTMLGQIMVPIQCSIGLRSAADSVEGDVHALMLVTGMTSLMQSQFDQDTGVSYVRLVVGQARTKLVIQRKMAHDSVASCVEGTTGYEAIGRAQAEVLGLIDQVDNATAWLQAKVDSAPPPQ